MSHQATEEGIVLLEMENNFIEQQLSGLSANLDKFPITSLQDAVLQVELLDRIIHLRSHIVTNRQMIANYSNLIAQSQQGQVDLDRLPVTFDQTFEKTMQGILSRVQPVRHIHCVEVEGEAGKLATVFISATAEGALEHMRAIGKGAMYALPLELPIDPNWEPTRATLDAALQLQLPTFAEEGGE